LAAAPNSDLAIRSARASLERVRAQRLTPARRQLQRHVRRAQRFAVIAAGGVVMVLVAAIIIGLIYPLGIVGVLAGILAMMMVFAAAAVFSREAAVRPETIARGSLTQIAQRTDQWLDQQRRALPAPAQTLADTIGARLAALGPQLATMDERAPQAAELRRLVGDELPQLINSYQRVPENMRRTDRNGRVAEAELIEGMQLLDRQIDSLSHDIAGQDMDRLSSHKRYLELRYENDQKG
jgi:hypothetical protein